MLRDNKGLTKDEDVSIIEILIALPLIWRQGYFHVIFISQLELNQHSLTIFDDMNFNAFKLIKK